MFKLAELNPQKGDVVKIKFKSINQVMEENLEGKTFHDIEEYYQIQENIKAYVAGGDFLVDAAISDDEVHKDDPYIEIKNHMDTNYCVGIHESIIESIEMVDAAEVFVSNDLKIIAVRIDNEMFINGHPMIWDEVEKRKDRYGEEGKENHNRKLIRMFERFITDLAVQDSFQYIEEEKG